MDAQKIMQGAKDALLSNGEHTPTIFFEFVDGSMIMCPIIDPSSSTTKEKSVALFSVGRTIGMEYHDRELQNIAFISEAWSSKVAPGQHRKYKRPSDDPQRGEQLLAMFMEIQGEDRVKQSAHRCELIRNRRGELIDLGPTEIIAEGIKSTLPLSIYAGFISRDRSDEELLELARKEVR